MGLPDINFPLQNQQSPQLSIFPIVFVFVFFVAIFLKVYKCERKLSKFVGKIKPAFPEKTFDFLSETKDREIKGFVICLAKIKLCETTTPKVSHFQRFFFLL